MELFGTSRSRARRDHALIASDSLVRAPLPGWERTPGVVLIAPPMGARFAHYLAYMEEGGLAGPPAPGVERVVYVLDGTITVKPLREPQQTLTAGGFAFVPADELLALRAEGPTRLNVFEKRYVPRPGVAAPPLVVGREQTIAGVPFHGDPDTRLQTLLPDTPAFDLAVNLFHFRPGAALPLVEVRVVEHGLLILAGQGIYRLGEEWYPVRAGDAVWIGSFCPQWFVAMGTGPAAYLCYEDANRAPFEGRP